MGNRKIWNLVSELPLGEVYLSMDGLKNIKNALTFLGLANLTKSFICLFNTDLFVEERAVTPRILHSPAPSLVSPHEQKFEIEDCMESEIRSQTVSRKLCKTKLNLLLES